ASVGMAIVTNIALALSPPNTLGRTPIFFDAGDSISFSFDTPILAFGISFNTFATAPGAYLVTTNLGDVAPSSFDPFPGATPGQFAGLVSDTPFTSVVVSSPGGFSFTLHDMTYATVVPEPASLTLLGLGTLGLLGYGWRSRRRMA